MHDASVAAPVDLKIVFPEPGTIRVLSNRLFAEPDDASCRDFVRRALLADEVFSVSIVVAKIPAVDLRFDEKRHGRKSVLQRIS